MNLANVNFRTGMAEQIEAHIPPEILRVIAPALPADANAWQVINHPTEDRPSGIYFHQNDKGGMSVIAIKKAEATQRVAVGFFAQVSNFWQTLFRSVEVRQETTYRSFACEEFKFLRRNPKNDRCSFDPLAAAVDDPRCKDLMRQYEIDSAAHVLEESVGEIQELQRGNNRDYIEARMRHVGALHINGVPAVIAPDSPPPSPRLQRLQATQRQIIELLNQSNPSKHV